MKGERESRSQNLEFGILKPGDGSQRRFRRYRRQRRYRRERIEKPTTGLLAGFLPPHKTSC